MLPAPASIASPPIQSSGASWNPAVPPPPVGGAAAGTGLIVGLDVCAATGEGVAVAVSVGPTAALAVAVAVAVAVLVGVAVDVAEVLAEGDDEGRDAEGEDPPVQAEIATEASRAAMPQPTAVSLARSPVPTAVVCTFMKPPHASGMWRSRSRKRRGP
jgi:hypothetical protein